MMAEREFVRGNDRIARLLQDPERSAAVKAIREEMDEADTIYAATLSAVRQAGELTQAELAARLGVTQGAVSQLERRSDMLLSTLWDYLTAAGAENPRVVVTIKGVDMELSV